MRQLILKVPAGVFLLFLFGPLAFWYYFRHSLNADNYLLIAVISGSIISFLWYFSLIDYMSTEAKTRKNVGLLKLLVALNVIWHMSDQIYRITNPNVYSVLPESVFWLKVVGSALLSISIALILTKLIKNVFYARSGWWVFIEVLVVPVGMISLTPDIQKWEKGPKE